ncbi:MULTISPECIES: ImmA/IrrE family metallo-endopeptidase [unclassified Streptomyces]|uniref:ImmA/IrrE family metallo-endopeptidase n=1 Tax=Streptomyces sp. NPDC127532 TaxID=3345399 RepID=UPI0036391553
MNRERPLVIAHSGRSDARKRFTLAHELGHIELAWHTATLECSPEKSSIEAAGTSIEVLGQEREANEFASKLLVPPSWLRTVTDGTDHFDQRRGQEVLNHLAKAEVSATAGVIALASILLPGHAFFIGTSFSVSRGTPWPGERPLSATKRLKYLSTAYSSTTFRHQGIDITWAQMHSPMETPHVATTDNRTSTQVLRSMVGRCMQDHNASSIVQSVNGVVGGLTTDVDRGWTKESIAAVVSQRISSNQKLSPLSSDPEFTFFVLRKSEEVLAKRMMRK